MFKFFGIFAHFQLKQRLQISDMHQACSINIHYNLQPILHAAHLVMQLAVYFSTFPLNFELLLIDYVYS